MTNFTRCLSMTACPSPSPPHSGPFCVIDRSTTSGEIFSYASRLDQEMHRYALTSRWTHFLTDGYSRVIILPVDLSGRLLRRKSPGLFGVEEVAVWTARSWSRSRPPSLYRPSLQGAGDQHRAFVSSRSPVHFPPRCSPPSSLLYFLQGPRPREFS